MGTVSKTQYWMSLESMEVLSYLLHIWVALGFATLTLVAVVFRILPQVESSP